MTEQLGWIQAIILGIAQGLTEFLPISSSAHTLIISKIAGWPDPGAAFTAVTQIGTELAVLIYFWNDIKEIFVAWLKSLTSKSARREPNAKLGWYIILGSIPIGILGISFQDQIQTTARNLYLVATTLIVMGLLLGLFDQIAKHTNDADDLKSKHAVLFGIGQALALIPGVSRSGATITFGLAMGFKREFAARYSFLLALPAVFASGLLETKDIGSDSFVNWPATILATVVAFGVGYAVIATLMNYLKTKSFKPFVYYRVSLGILVLILLQTGVIAN
jgi:undecaprenyl-diphosphatase